jgi:hypothetical protein
MNYESELKPCPLCGEKVYIEAYNVTMITPSASIIDATIKCG